MSKTTGIIIIKLDTLENQSKKTLKKRYKKYQLVIILLEFFIHSENY